MDDAEKKLVWEIGYIDCLLELKELLAHPENQPLYWQLLPLLEHAKEIKKLDFNVQL